MTLNWKKNQRKKITFNGINISLMSSLTVILEYSPIGLGIVEYYQAVLHWLILDWLTLSWRRSGRWKVIFWFNSKFCCRNLSWESGGFEFVFTITEVLQPNRLTKCASHPETYQTLIWDYCFPSNCLMILVEVSFLDEMFKLCHTCAIEF